MKTIQKIIFVLLFGSPNCIFAGTGMGGGIAGSFVDTQQILIEKNFERHVLVAGKNSLIPSNEISLIGNLALIADLEYIELQDLSLARRPFALKLPDGGIRSFWVHEGPIAGTLELAEFAEKD